jgi:autotransporter-associated beta strand protein
MMALAILVFSTSAPGAVNMIWDANGDGSLIDGGGNWNGGSTWWTGSADSAWVAGNHAIIGFTNAGTYSLTNNGAVSAGFVTFKTNNYTLSGSTLTVSSINMSNSVTATINCPISTPGGGITVSQNGTLTLGGGYASTTGNPPWRGFNSAATSTLNITNGTYTEGGTFTGDAITVNQTGGAVAFNIWNMGRNVAANAIWNLNGGSLRSTAANALTISRGQPAFLNVGGTGLLGTLGFLGIASTTATDTGTLSVSNGIANIGTGITGTPGVSSASLGTVNLLASGAALTYSAGRGATFNVAGGVVTAKGIQFGSSTCSYVNNPFCNFNLTGGTLYLDSSGIAFGSGVTTLNTLAVTLSGGTIAATANWAASVPITLTTTNGNLIVQAADTNGTPWNITWTGPVSGLGGLTKTGGGILNLSGTNTYSGSTTVSNGQLTVTTTTGGASIGAVSFPNTGTTLSTALAASGQSWTNTSLVISNGNTVDFNFGGFQASPSVSVIQVNGDLSLDSSDNFTVEGTALLTGTYPLMTCTGALTLTGGASLPSITSLPGGVTAHLSQAGKTINLVVTSSPNSIIKWGASASGPWDFSTADWVNAGSLSAVAYSDGIATALNDNATSAVTITLNTTVQPLSLTANNSVAGTASYTITGSGTIGGSTGILLQGTGILALGTTNTYSGGTTVNSGTLGINYGGDGSGPTAIGTGALTLNAGAKLDNTSGSNVLLNSPIQENWNGNFSYVGSQTNLDLGVGPVTLGGNLAVSVLSNILTCGGVITDNGFNYELTVQGPGTLTLAGLNTYTGGTVLNSGKLNINNGGDGGADSAIGTGRLSINGGTIDNTSGADVQLQTAIPETWSANFNFGGSTNLDLGTGQLTVTAVTLTLQNGAILRTEGQMLASGAGGVATLTLAGNGTFQTSGTANNTSPGNVGLSVAVNNGAVFQMDKTSSAGVHSTLSLNVNTGGKAIVTGTGGHQIGTAAAGVLTLAGGTCDLNGSSENVFSGTFTSGTLQNNLTNSDAALTMVTSNRLNGAACKFDVATNSSLTIPSLVWGTGSLVKIGAGTLNLGGSNTYTGSTIVSNGLLTFTTATLANRNYTNAAGELQAVLDPTGAQLQMTMSNVTFGAGTRLGFDLASGGFGDTLVPMIAAGVLTMNGNVAIDITNAPADTNDDVLLSYTTRHGPGVFVAGNVPVGAYIYDNTINGTVTLTYTQPPPPAPAFAFISSTQTGGVLTGINFSGYHGPPGGSYHILSSTNVALQPLSAWTVVQSGTFDSSGSFSASLSVSPGTPQLFYRLRVP